MNIDRLKRVLVASTIVAAMSGATLAAAGPSGSGCPTRFELVRERQALKLLKSEDNPDPESFFAAVDKNEDNRICVQDQTNTVQGTTYHNYIDNNANQ